MAPAATLPPHGANETVPSDPPNFFDVYKTYTTHLTTNPQLPPALAAISALTAALTSHHLSTLSEALSLLDTLAKTLRKRLENPIPASAGIDVFLHYLVTTAARPGALTGDFKEAIKAVTQVGEGFVRKGLQAREAIKRSGHKIIGEGVTVVVPVLDELVEGMLLDAAEEGVEFRAVFVRSVEGQARLDRVTEQLGQYEVTSCSIENVALADALVTLLSGRQDGSSYNKPQSSRKVLVLFGAVALLSDGGVLAPIGTLQACLVAKTLGVEAFVASEMLKSVRQASLSLEVERVCSGGALKWGYGAKVQKKRTASEANGMEVEITPPQYLTAIATENGVVNTDAIAEESIRIWF